MDMKKVRAANPVAALMIENMKNDLLLLFVHRLGGKVEVPVAEIDEFPKGKAMTMQLSADQKTFTFEVIER